MKVVIDTNVIIDAIALRQPFCRDAEKILLMVSEDKLSGWLTANSITDIYYVIRRSLSESEARKAIRSLLYSLDVIEVTGEDCWRALNLDIDDFEDALLAACAEKIKVDYIVSRDNEFINKDSPVQVISPAELLEKLSQSGIL